MPTEITKAERDSLLMICRQRARVAKAEVDAVAAERKAQFAAQLAAVYHWDQDANWKEAHRLAEEAVTAAQVEIEKRNAKLGIPKRFGPNLHVYWESRGENGIASRRAELTRVAHTRIEANSKAAKHVIDKATVEVQTKLVGASLETAEARAFLESMPKAEELMPVIQVDDIQKQLQSERWRM